MQTIERVNLPTALKDPGERDYETQRIDADGHLYIYRYSAIKEIFLRATVPSGATAPVFKTLSDEEPVPVGGWIAV